MFDIFKAGTMLRAARRFPEPLATLLCLFIPRRLIQTRKEQFAFGVERVDKRLQQTTDRPDFSESFLSSKPFMHPPPRGRNFSALRLFFCSLIVHRFPCLLTPLPVSYILNAEGEKGMTIEETYTAAQVLIVAGSETSATALCGSTYLLLSNPSTLTKLTSEVRAAFATEAEILPHATAGLPYLSAVIEEALRLCPPGPGTFPRRVPEGGRIVCDRFVPGGTAVGVHQVSTHRDPRNFVRPLEFRPERWLGDPEFDGDNRACFRELLLLPPHAQMDVPLTLFKILSHLVLGTASGRSKSRPYPLLSPFQMEARVMLIRITPSLAYAETRTVLARMVWNFDMKLHPESVGWLDRQKTYTTWQKDEMKVEITPRARV